MKKYLIILFAFLPVFLFGRSLEEIKESGVIYAAFTESNFNSINYKIALEFAKFLNVELVPIITSWDENFMDNGVRPTDLETNPEYSYTPDALKKADFICGTIYVFDWRKKIYDYAGIMQVSDLLVVKKMNKDWDYLTKLVIPEEYLDYVVNEDIRVYADLKNRNISLLQNSSYVENISIIDDKLNNTINVIQTVSEEESQQLLLDNKVDGFVAVSYLALKFINEHSNYAKLAFPIGKPFDVGWAVENNNFELANEINNFFETIKGDGTLNVLFQNTYGIDYKTYLGIINSYAGNDDFSARSYDDIVNSGKLVVALREREMIYQANGAKQFSHYLAEALANFLNLELEIKIVPSISDYFTASDGLIYQDSSYSPDFFNDVDVACDLLAPVPWRMSKVDIIGYMPNALVVVGNKNLKITTVADLKKLKGVTAQGSSYENALLSNNITDYFYAGANDLLDIVDRGQADYTIASFSIYSLPDYSNLEAKFILGEIEKAGWAVKRNQPKLRQKVLEFFDYAKKNGTLDNFFKTQTGMPFKAAEKFLIALHQTYNIGVFPFVFYGSDNGLPQENITSIFEDNEGYIWFGTFSGAVKFNGRKMEVFNNSNGLISNEVLDIKQDNNSVIYFATLSGISTFDGDVFDSLFVGTPFKNIYIDQQNRKFFYGDAGIVIYSDTSEFVLNDVFGFNLNSVRSLTQIPFTQTYLIGTGNGLFLFDIEKFSVEQINDLNVYSVFIDADENIWISAKEGVYNTNNYSLMQKDLGETINSKSNIKSTIHKITQTNDGAIWLIGNFEVYQIFSLNLSPIVYDQSIGLSGQKILSFFVDNEENIWFGYYGGVQKLTNKSLRVIYPDKLKYYVNNIVQDELNHFWFGFNNRLFVLADSLIDLTSKFANNYNSFVVTQNSSNNIIVA
ncbi:MAG: transporter substrate-binding domain-containing protein, partial [Bacteroidales bacterium]|nr:transporter substrate-binding domain-containing protein [Bacteroidales bacterium]